MNSTWNLGRVTRTWLLWMVSATALTACGGGGGGGNPDPDPVTYQVSVGVSGGGSVTSTSGAINCGTTCSTTVPSGSDVTLNATASAGNVFSGWGGACSGTGSSCTVNVTQATSVTATFAPSGGGGATNFALAVAVTGNGSVSSQPAGIACGSTCNANFAASTSVTLTATPAQGQVFQSWGGACTGSTATCAVTMSAARSVTATFAAAPAAGRAWAGATLMESSNDFNIHFGNAGPLTAIDAQGNALAMWEQSDGTPDGSTRKIYSRRYVAGQGWATATTIPNVLVNSGAIALDGKLFVDGSGQWTWVDTSVIARRYTPSSGWASATIDSANPTIGSLADAHMDANGTIHALRQRDGNVWHATLPAGANAWTAWVAVGGTTTAANGGARLALSSTGAVAIWKQRNPGDSNESMWANRLTGGAWQTPVRIEEVVTQVRGIPAVVADAAGNAVAAWHQGTSLYVNRLDAASGTWGTAQEVDAGQISSSSNARIGAVMHADGRAVIGWNSGIFILKTMSFAPGTGFAAPVTAASYSIDRTLHMDRDARVVIVHRTDPGFPSSSQGLNVYTQELPWGGAWTTNVRLDTGPVSGVLDNISFAMNASGLGVAAWAQNDIAGSSVRNSLWSNLRR